VTSIDWDAYRRDYDRMSAADQEAFYDRVWQDYPHQKFFNASACASYLASFTPTTVVEIGGWRGELAAEMLTRFPSIKHWTNVEVCRGAREASACTDPRYEYVPPTALLPFADAVVSSHAIEHMLIRELVIYLEEVRPRSVFLQAPLTEEGQAWDGYQGSHVMREGWREVRSELARLGLRHVPHFDAHEVRCFSRGQPG
jgi:hypothetical protein